MSESIQNSDIVVYTAISQKYDSLKQQPNNDGIDFVAFVEDEIVQPPWQTKSLIQHSSDPNRNAKIYKVLSHNYFPKKQYSLWIDGSIILKVSPRFLIDIFLGDFDMVVHKNPHRDCTYKEAKMCQRLGLDEYITIEKQMTRYRQDGFSENFGSHENAIILRRNNERVNKFNELWWREIEQGSRRDILSSVYASSKMGLSVGFFPGCISQHGPTYSGFFTYTKHQGDNRWKRIRRQ